MQISGSTDIYKSGSFGGTRGQYDASIQGLAGLLSTQGEEILPPNSNLALHAPTSAGETSSSTGAATIAADAAAPTAFGVAQQMIDSLGSNGLLTLSDVEKAENGSTSPSANTTFNSNCSSDICRRFRQTIEWDRGYDGRAAYQCDSALHEHPKPIPKWLWFAHHFTECLDTEEGANRNSREDMNGCRRGPSAGPGLVVPKNVLSGGP
jgi:hypothetical protein